MKTFKRLLPLIFTLTVITVMLVITSMSTSAATYSGKCGTKLTWELDTGIKRLTISGTGSMSDYEYRDSYIYSDYRNAAPWRAYLKYIQTIIINDGVTYIGDGTFMDCYLLTKISIPNSVTRIGKGAFSDCDALTEIKIPSSVTRIADSAFWDSHGIEKLYIDDIVSWCNIEFVSETSNPLYYAKNLYLNNTLVTDLVIPDAVTSIKNYAFSRGSFKSVSIPNSVKSIGTSAFLYCSQLTDITIPDSVTSVGVSCFEECENLKNVTLGNSLKAISDRMFLKCKALESVAFGNNVTSIGTNSFYYCIKLDGITFPSGLKTIGLGSFFECHAITELIIPDSVTSLGDSVFARCKSLKSITVYESVTMIDEDAFTESPCVINCYEDSYVHLYALANNIKYNLMHKCEFTNYVNDDNATCTEDGTKTAYCDNGCGATDTVVIEGTAGHRYDNDCDADCNVCGDVRTAPHSVRVYIYNLTNASNYPFALSDGVYSSTNKANSSSATVTLTAISDCSIKIDYYTSTESGYDKLIIKHNSTTKVTASGQTSWKSVTINVLNGDKIYITYSKDSSQSSGNDKVYFKLSADEVLTDASGVEATCLDGVVCELCGATVKDALGHSFTSYVSDSNATCTEDGTKTAKCDRCDVTDTRTDTDTALGHSFTNYISDGNATCESDGTKTAKCDRCDATDTLPDEGSKIPHRYNNYSYNGDATCTEDGTRTSPCDYGCGRTKTKVAEKTALGHSYTDTVTKSATCTENGEALYVCSRCADSYTESIAALGHSYDNVCDAECNACGDIRNVEPHCVKKNLYNIDNNSQYPFILKDGIYTSSNTRNDSSGSMTLTALNDGSITIDYYTSTERNYDKLIIIHNSTTEVTASGETSWSSVTISVTKGDTIYIFYTKDGSSSSGDDKVYFKLSPAAINYNANDIEATCLDSVVCDVCGTIVKDALGHSFTNYVSKNNATCTADGTKTARCDRCNVTDTQNEEGSALGHSFTNYISDGNTTCTEDGTKTAKCDRCDATDTVTDTSEMAEHVYGEWYTATEPTYEEKGMERRDCTRCSVYEERELPIKVYANKFTDVKETAWFADAVEYCVKKGYVSGMSETTFVPNGKLTRAQFLVLLAKLDGVDLTQYDTTNAGFADVKTSHWFNEVVCWAVENGYTSGISATQFGPNNNVTRAQLARFFYVYCEKKGISIEGRANLSGYPDASKVPSWAQTPVEWAVNAGLISGVKKDGVNYLDPNGTATRAQAAVMFKAFDTFRNN